MLALLAICVLVGCADAEREETRARFMAMGVELEGVIGAPFLGS